MTAMALQDKLQNETKEGRKHKRTNFTLLIDFTTDKLTLKLLNIHSVYHGMQGCECLYC